MTSIEKTDSLLGEKDYYEVLSLNRDGVTKEKVKKAFMAKALLWHPDKATNPSQVEIYTKIYEELQIAYKTLSNDELRHQYNAARQSTAIDLINQERDRHYERDVKYTTFTNTGYVFDREAFIADAGGLNEVYFESPGEIDPSGKKTNKQKTVKQSDYEKYLKEREMQDVAVLDIFPQDVIKGLDRNMFHETFDKLKQHVSQARGVQEVYSCPGAYDPDYMPGGIEDNFHGNPQLYFSDVIKNLSLDSLSGKEEYGKEGILDYASMITKMKEIEDQSKILSNIKLEDFDTQPTEIEKLYASFYKTPIKDISEGLEATSHVKKD